MSQFSIWKIEVFLRLCAVFTLVFTALLVGLDTETKEVFYRRRRATFKYLNALSVMVYADSAAAGYNLLQLCKCGMSGWLNGNMRGNFTRVAWICFLLDQITVYLVFASRTAALEASILALTGERSLQWIEWCNKFSRFCLQIAGALTCGYAASLVMIGISIVSAFNLFRLYSPNHFMVLKRT